MIHRLTLIAIAFAFVLPSLAQKEFAHLPAKVKLRMAQEEETASDADPEFQRLMSSGMTHFENREYELAIDKFEAAGQRRPINVYPPVMIEDVKLAMSLPQEEEEIEEEPIVEEEPIQKEPEMTAEERVEKMYQEELAKVYAELPKDPPPVKKEPKIKEPEPTELTAEGLEVRDAKDIIADGGVLMEDVAVEEVVEAEIEEVVESKEVSTPVIKETQKESTGKEEPKSLDEIQEELGAEFPDGMTEEIFTEGNRTITKRVVVIDGKGDEYRKVKHGWGGIFYFKNGTSITERVWKEDTE